MSEIIIGGRLPAALLAGFLDEIGSTGAKVGGHDGLEFGVKTVEELRRGLDKNGHLVLAVDQVQQFAVADFCVKHGIAFDRRGDGGNVCFRHGMNKPMPLDTRCEALLDTGNIRPVAKELAGLVTIALTKEKVLAAAVKVIRHLNALLPPEIEPLPPLEIEE